MSMLTKGIAGAAGAAADYYKEVNLDALEAIRQRRLSEIGDEFAVKREGRAKELMNEQRAYDETQTQAKRTTDLEDYEAKRKIDAKYSPSSDDLLTEKDLYSEYSKFVIEERKNPMSEGAIPNFEQWKSQYGPSVGKGSASGAPAAGASYTMAELREAAKGRGLSEEQFQALAKQKRHMISDYSEPGEPPPVTKAQPAAGPQSPVQTDTSSSKLQQANDQRTFTEVSDMVANQREKITPAMATALLNRLSSLGDVGTNNYQLLQLRNVLTSIATSGK